MSGQGPYARGSACGWICLYCVSSNYSPYPFVQEKPSLIAVVHPFSVSNKPSHPKLAVQTSRTRATEPFATKLFNPNSLPLKEHFSTSSVSIPHTPTLLFLLPLLTPSMHHLTLTRSFCVCVCAGLRERRPKHRNDLRRSRRPRRTRLAILCQRVLQAEQEQEEEVGQEDKEDRFCSEWEVDRPNSCTPRTASLIRLDYISVSCRLHLSFPIFALSIFLGLVLYDLCSQASSILFICRPVTSAPFD